jgi:hypothetical protein
MHFNPLFAHETSRSNTDYVRDIIYQKPELYGEVVEIVLLNEEPYSRRAIWVMDICDEENPGFAEPYLASLIYLFDQFNHDGMRRHTLRMLSRHKIPEDQTVRVMDICFSMLTLYQAAAIKVHAMEILYKLSHRFPEIKRELAEAIELSIQEGTAGVKNRGKRTLQKLYKEMS